MQTSQLTLSIESRNRQPYKALSAAILFQSFRDALAEEMESLSSESRDTHAVPAGPGREAGHGAETHSRQDPTRSVRRTSRAPAA